MEASPATTAAPSAPEPPRLRFFTNPPTPPPLSAAARPAPTPSRQPIRVISSRISESEPGGERPEPHVQYRDRLKAAATLASPTEQLIWMAGVRCESMAATKLRMTRAMLGMPEMQEKDRQPRVAVGGSRRVIRGPPNSWERGGEVFATARFRDPMPAAAFNRKGVKVMLRAGTVGGGAAGGTVGGGDASVPERASGSGTQRSKRAGDHGKSRGMQDMTARASPGPSGVGNSSRDRRRRSGRASAGASSAGGHQNQASSSRSGAGSRRSLGGGSASASTSRSAAARAEQQQRQQQQQREDDGGGDDEDVDMTDLGDGDDD